MLHKDVGCFYQNFVKEFTQSQHLCKFKEYAVGDSGVRIRLAVAYSSTGIIDNGPGCIECLSVQNISKNSLQKV